MDNGRRDFIKKTAILMSGVAAVSAIPVITSCSNRLNPFSAVVIDKDLCVGCGECLQYCFYDAIILPERTPYWIEAEECNSCGDCVDVCKYDAFEIIKPNYYKVEDERCVGCGDCIDVCIDEGDAITYERDYYFARGRCKPDRCHHQCMEVCPEEGAVTLKAGDRRVSFDMAICTKCGLCVVACPYEAINPAKVVIDAEKCTSCGKCIDECDENYLPEHSRIFKAIEQVFPNDTPAGYVPRINPDKCVSCADCLEPNICDYKDAIKREIKIAEIDGKECRECGNCIPNCRFDAIIEEN